MSGSKDSYGGGGGRGTWRDVKRGSRCPICDGDSWCQIRYDGAYVLCRRVQAGSQRTRQGAQGEFYVHLMDANSTTPYEPREGPEALKNVEQASIDVLDRVYRLILAELQLSEEHRANLRGRGLTDEDIKTNQYRTLPIEGRSAIAKRIVDKIGAEAAQGVPGLYVKESDGKTWWTLGGAAGLVVPMRNPVGQIFALKSRRDGAKGDAPRYTYISSAAHGGAKAISDVHVTQGLVPDYAACRVTEGELKSDVVTRLSLGATISVPGVGSCHLAIPVLRQLGTDTVLVALDADHSMDGVPAETKPEVALALVTFCRSLTPAGFEWAIELWDPALGKGVDDVWSAGHGDKITLCHGDAATKYLAELEKKAHAELEDRARQRAAKLASEAKPADPPAAADPPAGAKPTAGAKVLDLEELRNRVKEAKKKEADAEKAKVAEKRVATHKNGRAAVVAAMREQMGLPPDDKTPAATATMQRGDDAELAFHALRTLQRGSPELVIWDGERLRRYEPNNGLWEALLESDYYCVAVLFAGCLVGPPDAPPEKLKPLKLSRAAISGSYDIAQNLRYRSDFFANAPKGLLFNNGFVTVKDGKITLLPHSPAHRALHTMGFDWDPQARAPRWNEFLNGIFTMPDEIGNGDGDGSTLPPGEIAARALDRDQKITFIHEFVGASLIGEATDYAVAPILVGEGNNGKSTFIDTVKSLFPPKSVASITPQQFDNPTYLAALRGVRLNSCAEMPPKDIVDNEAFKSVISGDTKTVRHLYGHPFECTFEAGQMYAGNKLPGTSDMSEGFWRRVMPILFARAFNNDRILGLSRMLKEERPGIVRLALEAAARLQLAKKYTVPESAVQLKKAWRNSNDQVGLWYEECARSADTDEQEAIAQPGYAPNTRKKYEYGVAALAAYESYAVWARRNGHDRPLTSANFYPRMKKILDPLRLWKRKTLSVIYEIRLIELHSNVIPFQRSGRYDR